MPLRLALCTLGLLVACDGDVAVPGLPTAELVETGVTFHDNLSVSPDGLHIGFTGRDGEEEWVYIADVDGGNARRVSLLARQVTGPVFSPDGSSLAWLSANSHEIWSVPVAGGDPLRLVAAEVGGPVRFGDPVFSPDGSRIYFTRNNADRVAVWSVPSSGGDIAPLLPDAQELTCCARWSPDGTRIALTRGEYSETQGQWMPYVAVVDPATGAVERITTEGYEQFTGWSPDGAELMFVSERSGQDDIWTIPVTGGEGRQLTRDVRDDYDPVYSPDGRWVAYRSNRGAQNDIWIVPAAGGEAVRVTNDRASEADARWSVDGRALFYMRADYVPGLYAVPASGGTPRRLSPADQNEWRQDISPDGQTIAHLRRQAGLSEIWLTPIDGGDARPLITGSENFTPLWSPDGSMIAYASDSGSSESVRVVDVATGEDRQVSPSDIDMGLAGWSPDGARVHIGRLMEPDRRARFLAVPPTGGEPTPLLETSGVPNRVAWSPDGSILAVTQIVDGDPGLYLYPSGGGPGTLLTSGQRVYASSAAAWSSDGRRIAYAVFSTDGGLVDIWVVNADGSGRRRLTSAPTEQWFPQWSPDDSEIYFLSGRSGMGAVDVATGEVRTIYEGGVRSAVNFYWQGFDITPDGETIVFGGRIDGNYVMRVDVSELLSASR